MALPTLETIAAAWALASGIGIAGLGILSLGGGRSRPWGALPLGLFAVAWGLQIVTGNLTRIVSDPALATDLMLLSAAALLPLPFFLIEFAAQQTGPSGGSAGWRLARLATGIYTVAGAVVFAVSPGLFLQDVQAGGAVLSVTWGPMMTVAQIAFFASLGVTLIALVQGLENAPTPRIARRALILFTGLGLYVSYAAGSNLSFYAMWVSRWGFVNRNVPFLLAFLALTGLTLWVLGRVLLRLNDARRSEDRWRYRVAAGALVLPLLWGLTEGYVVYTNAPRLDTLGLWRLLAVGVVTYGLARWRIFDLPQRAQRVAASTTGVTGAVAGGAATFSLTSLVTPSLAIPAVGGLLVSAVGLAPAVRVARRLFGVDRDEASEDHEETLYGQRLDAYRAALEASIARGTLEEDEAFLEALRERFDIGEEGDMVLRHFAKQAVVLPSDRTVDQAYERLRLLGQGGGGRTWLARDRARDRLVVLKEPLAHWIDDQALKQKVLKEARAAARVQHPNVVRFHEIVDDNGTPVIVMAYIDGGSLDEVLRTKGVLRWQRARAIVSDVLEGLQAVHAAGLIHRDIKPANILLTGDGQAKLADFGIAQHRDHDDTVVETQGQQAGTRAYMAPEVAQGQPHTEASDVYACGAVLYEALYGSPPRQGRTVEVENTVPEPLKAVVAKATSSDPSRRYPNAQAFLEALADVRPG